MANFAENTNQINFPENSTLQDKKNLFEEMESNFFEFSVAEEDIEEYNSIVAYYDSKWSEDIDFLQAMCEKYNVNMVGTCFEPGCSYANSWDINPDFGYSEPLYLAYDKFFETYKPLKNPYERSVAFGSCLFYTNGENAEFVNKQAEKMIWSLCAENKDIYIISGKSDKAEGYFVATKCYDSYKPTKINLTWEKP